MHLVLGDSCAPPPPAAADPVAKDEERAGGRAGKKMGFLRLLAGGDITDQGGGWSFALLRHPSAPPAPECATRSW